MEIMKRTIKSGNASAVVLPKAWLNRNVKVELIDQSHEIILQEVMEIVKSKMELSKIIGVYLVGSYAREEQDEHSDIDILIISEDVDSELIKVGSYEIIIVSLKLLNYKLKDNLLPIGTMLTEAKPLLNSYFLKTIKIDVTKQNVKWYIETTKDRLKSIKESIDTIKEEKPDGKLNDLIVYSLVLRIRTMHMIDCLINNKKYDKKKFMELINEISGSKIAYERYVYAKSNENHQRHLLVDEAEKLYSYLAKYLEKVKNMLKK